MLKTPIKEINNIVLHSGQSKIHSERARFNVVRCGRRFGKTRLLEALAFSYCSRGEKVGIFTPEYRQIQEPRENLVGLLWHDLKAKNKNEGYIETKIGGKIDFWTLNDNELAGRGREYDVALIDEAAFTKSPQMLEEIWLKSIRPTLLTTQGGAWVFSTPKGVDPDNFFYAVCREEKLGFKEHYAPTKLNPMISEEDLAFEQTINDPLVFRQEYLAEFIDWSGVAFFNPEKMLINHLPVDYPDKCDTVYAVIDTAVKGGMEHDGTAVIYMALNKYGPYPLTILDWDVIQIDGALLESWMPSVFTRLEELSRICGARKGVAGTFIEDTATGSILLQQGRIRGWNTIKIDSLLTSKGKDERAVDVSGYYHQEKMKISLYAYDKKVVFKGHSRNHLLAQMGSFRLGDKDAYRRSDDLLDAVVYSIAIGVGDKYGL